MSDFQLTRISSDIYLFVDRKTEEPVGRVWRCRPNGWRATDYPGFWASPVLPTWAAAAEWIEQRVAKTEGRVGE